MVFTRAINALWMITLLLMAICKVSKAALPQFDPSMTKAQRHLVKEAFVDALTLVRTAAVTFTSDTDIYFGRYFAISDGTFVRQMLRTIAAVDPNFDQGDPDRDTIRRFVYNLKPDQLNADFAGLSISYGDNPGRPVHEDPSKNTKCGAFGLWGHLVFDADKPENAWMSICPVTFDVFYSIRTILKPPDALKNEPGMATTDLGNTETDYLETPGITVLHELMHWPYLFRNVPDYATKVRLDPDGHPQILDYTSTTEPKDGYGAYYAQQVKKLPNKGGFSEALNNADNYAWFANIKFWSRETGAMFLPPVSQNDYDRRASAAESEFSGPNSPEASPPQLNSPLVGLNETDSGKGVRAGYAFNHISNMTACYWKSRIGRAVCRS